MTAACRAAAGSSTRALSMPTSPMRARESLRKIRAIGTVSGNWALPRTLCIGWRAWPAPARRSSSARRRCQGHRSRSCRPFSERLARLRSTLRLQDPSFRRSVHLFHRIAGDAQDGVTATRRASPGRSAWCSLLRDERRRRRQLCLLRAAQRPGCVAGPDQRWRGGTAEKSPTATSRACSQPTTPSSTPSTARAPRTPSVQNHQVARAAAVTVRADPEAASSTPSTSVRPFSQRTADALAIVAGGADSAVGTRP